MHSKSAASHRQEGFSLIELMIGMTIGLIAAAVIIQVMSFFEAQRRATTGTADAQTNGGIAMYSIAREAQGAGFSLLPSTDSPLECVTLTYGTTGIGGITPVSITDGVAATGISASDSITIRYGTSQTGGAGTTIDSMAAGVATVKSTLGCQAGDVTFINTGPICAISKATAIGASPTTTVTLADTTGATSGANLACLGSWNEVTYAVNPTTGNLDRTITVSGVPVTTPTSVVGVVNLQAQYGISAAANSNQVTQWVDASGSTWSAPTLANRNRIKAIRIAVVARNAKIELAPVSAACSSTTAAAPTGLCAWEGTSTSPAPTIDLSQGDPNWAKYRYRVFETIIPLRNMIWSKDTL